MSRIAGGGVRRLDRLDAMLLVALCGLVLPTAAATVVPGFRVGFVAPGLDLFLDTAAAVITVTVAALMWVRYRERGEPVALVLAAAFLVLSIANVVTASLVIGRLDAGPVVTDLLPGQAPLYLSATAHLLAASLLAVGLWATRRGATTGHPWVTLVAPVAGTIGVTLLLVAFHPNLPELGSAFVLPDQRGSAFAQAAVPTSTALGWLVGGVSAGLFLAAAILARRIYQRAESIGDAYLTVGLVFAGFGQIHLALSPGAYPGLVSGGDLLRVGFDVALLLGIEAEARATQSGLRRANERLRLLKDAEADRSALEERARLARELHDGLSQDLWLAKLKVGRLASLPGLGPEAMTLSAELGDAIDTGLADARQAIIALRWVGDADAAFGDQLGRYVDDFADRSGLRAEFACEHGLPGLAARPEAEMLRIVQEALNNVRRHADATVVRVQVATEAGLLRVGVLDNGGGFDPEVIGDSAFGLRSMRERASLIGGRLVLDSRPHDGTRVWVEVPLALVTATGLSAVS